MAVDQISKDDFQKEVLDAKGMVLVDLYATWCGPCKIMEPIIEEVANEITNVKFVKIDVDTAPELATQYSIFSIPTLLIVKDGKIVSQLIGAVSKEAILKEINKFKVN